MKKMLVLMSFLAILLAGCVQKSVSSNESRNSNEITTDTSSTIKAKKAQMILRQMRSDRLIHLRFLLL